MKFFVRYFGYILLISAIFRILPILTGIIYDESILLFIIGMFISVTFGLFLLWIERNMESKESALTLAQALMLVALSFIVLPLIGSISFLPSFDYSIIDALFESISGFTTTGLTLYSSLDGLPKSLLLWRAETQWMGGIGIIMVFLFVASRLRLHANFSPEETETSTKATVALYQAQGFPQKIEAGLKKTTHNVILIYSGYTLLGILLLYMTGMDLFNSVAMSFTSLSTGGFAVSDVFYTSNIQLAILSVLMLLGSISFIAHNKLVQRRFKEFLLSFEKNVFFVFLGAGIIITFFVFKDFKVILFELVSAFTTTGYSITEISLLPHLFITVIMIGMVIGGGIASTAGGIKVSRVYSMIKMIPWMLKKLASPPHAIIPFRINKKHVDDSNLIIIAVFVFCFISIIIAGTIIFMLLGYSFLDSSFQIVSALGTVGLQTIELAGVGFIGKIVLMACMLLGRLEIFPLLILLRQVLRIK